MKVKFRSRKLKSSIIKVNEKVKDNVSMYKDWKVYGVTKNEGISITGNVTSEDLSEYIVVGGKTFAFNPYRVNIGSIGLSGEGFKGLVSPAYVVFKTKEDLLPDFLFHYLKSDFGMRLINWYGNRGGVRNALRFDDLGEIDIPDLSVEEQEKSLAKLYAAQDKLDVLNIELDQQQVNIGFLRQTILSEAVRGKLMPQDTSDEPAAEFLKRIKAEKEKLIETNKPKKEKTLQPITEEEFHFELPKGWMWCRLAEIAYVGNGSTPDKKEFTNNPTDIPFLKVYNIVDQKVNFHYKSQYIKKACHEGKLKRSICFSGDVLMNIVGPPLGKIAILPREIPECNINQAIVVIRPLVYELNQWIYWFLCEKTAVNAIVTKGTAGQDNISVTQSRNIVFPLPPFAEQKRIVEKLQALQQQLDYLEVQVRQSKHYAHQLFQSLLRDAFGVAVDIDFEIKLGDVELIKNRDAQAIENIDFTSMKIIEILHQAKIPIQASTVWKQSEYQNDIEEFYAELKKLVDEEKSVIEEKIGKESYLKLAGVEN